MSQAIESANNALAAAHESLQNAAALVKQMQEFRERNAPMAYWVMVKHLVAELTLINRALTQANETLLIVDGLAMVPKGGHIH